MLEIGVTIAVVVLAAAWIGRSLVGRGRPEIDGGAVSRSWLVEYRLAKRDSGWP